MWPVDSCRAVSARPVFLLLASLLLVWLPSGSPAALAQSYAPDDPQAQALIDRLLSVPIFTNFDSDVTHQIFERGQQLGNRADVFTVVGDSNSSSGDFLRPLGLDGNYCRLGPYADLQATIDYFSATPPLNGRGNSFTHDSLAADIGFSTASVLDPFWINTPQCDRNENAVICEYRLARPAVAVIMLGQIDINYGGPAPVEAFRANMETIIQLSIERGVIPVLTTIVFLPERDVWTLSMHYNNALLDLAETYQVPLINFWAAARSLPDSGIGPDRSHLKARVGEFCAFDGPEQELGGTLRNLITLQALDLLRRSVLSP